MLPLFIIKSSEIIAGDEISWLGVDGSSVCLDRTLNAISTFTRIRKFRRAGEFSASSVLVFRNFTMAALALPCSSSLVPT